MWNKDQHPEKKEIPGASSLAAGYFFLLGADKTRSVSVRPQRGMQSIPSLGVLIQCSPFVSFWRFHPQRFADFFHEEFRRVGERMPLVPDEEIGGRDLRVDETLDDDFGILGKVVV